MLYELKNYCDAHWNDAKLPENWGEIEGLLQKISAQLTSGSSEDLNLYNITSYPENFIKKSGYSDAMAALNEDISNVMELLVSQD